MTDTATARKSMDIGKQQVGTVYAKALMGACEVAGAAPDVMGELHELVDELLPKQPALAKLLESAELNADQQQALLDRVFQDTMHPTLLTFLKVVAAHGRLDCLTEILRGARLLFNRQRGVVAVHVTAACPLDDNMKRQIAEKLRESLGQEVDLESHVDPALIGGVVVRVGDKVYDGSVANQLRALRTETLNNSVQQMRAASERFATAT